MHGLENGEPEAFVQAGVDHGEGAGVEIAEGLFGNRALQDEAVFGFEVWPVFSSSAGEDQRDAVTLPNLSPGFDEKRQVFARFDRADAQEVGGDAGIAGLGAERRAGGQGDGHYAIGL